MQAVRLESDTAGDFPRTRPFGMHNQAESPRFLHAVIFGVRERARRPTCYRFTFIWPWWRSFQGPLVSYRAASRGSLKFAHHFGLTRFSSLGEQLTRQDSVTHSNNPASLLSSALCDTADLAAGERLLARPDLSAVLLSPTPDLSMLRRRAGPVGP